MKDFVARDLVVVKGDLDRFIVACAALRDLLVFCVRFGSANIARHRAFDAGDAFKIAFNAPKTPACNDELFGSGLCLAALKDRCDGNQTAQKIGFEIDHRVHKTLSTRVEGRLHKRMLTLKSRACDVTKV